MNPELMSRLREISNEAKLERVINSVPTASEIADQFAGGGPIGTGALAGTVRSIPGLLGQRLGWRGDTSQGFIDALRRRFPSFMRAADEGPDLGLIYQKRLDPYVDPYLAAQVRSNYSGIYLPKDYLLWHYRDVFPGGATSINTTTDPIRTALHEITHYLYNRKQGVSDVPARAEQIAEYYKPGLWDRIFHAQPTPGEQAVEAIARNVYRSGR